MRGSIRTFVGLLIVFGAAGGIDNNQNLLACVGIAILGLVLMASGVSAMNRKF